MELSVFFRELTRTWVEALGLMGLTMPMEVSLPWHRVGRFPLEKFPGKV